MDTFLRIVSAVALLLIAGVAWYFVLAAPEINPDTLVAFKVLVAVALIACVAGVARLMLPAKIKV